MSMKYSMWVAAGFFGAACLAEAHLVAGSLSLKGSESLQAGSSVVVKWRQDEGHDGKYDFKFSKDGGTTFTAVETGKQLPTSSGEISYSWTVPAEATTQGQFKVCQQAGGAACTNPTYMLKSGNFTVTSGTSIREAGASAHGAFLRFDALTSNLDVSFTLDKVTQVSVFAFDLKGKVIATLLEGEYKAGPHRFSLFSNGLNRNHTLVFQLRLGEQVHAFQ